MKIEVSSQLKHEQIKGILDNHTICYTAWRETKGFFVAAIPPSDDHLTFAAWLQRELTSRTDTEQQVKIAKIHL